MRQNDTSGKPEPSSDTRNGAAHRGLHTRITPAVVLVALSLGLAGCPLDKVPQPKASAAAAR
jgi:hypothetical protein